MRKVLGMFGLTVLLLGITGISYAEGLIAITGSLYTGATILSKLMWAACIVVGIALLMAAFTQYQIHRSNPKLVPLPVPITYFILAFIAFAIPFAERLMSEDNPESDDSKAIYNIDIDS